MKIKKGRRGRRMFIVQDYIQKNYKRSNQSYYRIIAVLFPHNLGVKSKIM